MADNLLHLVQRYADVHADRNGVATTPAKGLVILREQAPTVLQYAISKPLVAMVLQGAKRVTMGRETFEFGAGETLFIATDMPTVSQITSATKAVPYYSLVMELDTRIVANLVNEMGAAPFEMAQPAWIDRTKAEIVDTASRLLRLFDHSDAMAVLGEQLIRELHFWLLSSRHGGAIRALGIADSHIHRITRAIKLLRDHYTENVRVPELAQAAGMSLSAFHAHFRAITSMTPLQFQKQLRLIEARRRMLAEGASVSDAAYAVGYESVPQFTREYGRMFGLSPARDVREARAS